MIFWIGFLVGMAVHSVIVSAIMIVRGRKKDVDIIS